MSAPASEVNDIASLRLPVDYGATHGVKKLTVSVPVGKPSKTQFFQVHPDPAMTFPAAIFEDKDDGTFYLLTPSVAASYPDVARPVELYRAIDRQGNQRLIPVPLPASNGQRNPWHDSLLQAVNLSKGSWIRLAANKSAGSYDVYLAQGNLPAPDWPDSKMEDLVGLAFRGRIVDSEDHAIIRALQGRV